jgi:hypothetical protein
LVSAASQGGSIRLLQMQDTGFALQLLVGWARLPLRHIRAKCSQLRLVAQHLLSVAARPAAPSPATVDWQRLRTVFAATVLDLGRKGLPVEAVAALLARQFDRVDWRIVASILTSDTTQATANLTAQLLPTIVALLRKGAFR